MYWILLFSVLLCGILLAVCFVKGVSMGAPISAEPLVIKLLFHGSVALVLIFSVLQLTLDYANSVLRFEFAGLPGIFWAMTVSTWATIAHCIYRLTHYTAK